MKCGPMKALWLVGFCGLFGCSRSASQTGEPASASSATPAWVAAATRAPAELSKPALASRNDAQRPKMRSKVDAILDDAAAQAATAEGITKAATILKDGRATAVDPTWTGSGIAPWQAWLHDGGLAVLGDLVTRACAAKPNDAAVVAAIDTIELPPWFNSGGPDKGRLAADRNALRRAGTRCGTEAGVADPLL